MDARTHRAIAWAAFRREVNPWGFALFVVMLTILIIEGATG